MHSPLENRILTCFCIQQDYYHSLEQLYEVLYCILPTLTKVIELCDTDKSCSLMGNDWNIKGGWRI